MIKYGTPVRLDAVAKMRDEKRLHLRGLETKKMRNKNADIPTEKRKLIGEKGGLTNRLKKATITLPTIPPRRNEE